jgi:hypothetical protein
VYSLGDLVVVGELEEQGEHAEGEVRSHFGVVNHLVQVRTAKLASKPAPSLLPDLTHKRAFATRISREGY